MRRRLLASHERYSYRGKIHIKNVLLKRIGIGGATTVLMDEMEYKIARDGWQEGGGEYVDTIIRFGQYPHLVKNSAIYGAIVGDITNLSSN